MKPKILVVDDEKNITFVLGRFLGSQGFEVIEFQNPLLAKEYFQNNPVSVVITDLSMPQMSGLDFLSFCRGVKSDVPIIVLTAYGTIESAVESIKRGAFDYISKPFDNDELLTVVQKAYDTFRLRELEPSADNEASIHTYLHIGKSAAMMEIAKTIQKVAQSPTTILITGESGTGKELAAGAIHKLSDRALKPFIRINCAAIPHNLIESELFGYERGAFTGAFQSKPGRFELAHEGTLFLDEVAEMPLEMQVKLLRVIQESEFERVGGVNTIRVQVRLIAATNKDLAKEVKEGRVREDLYYRLNVVPLYLPPLRNRKEDIEDLISVFIRKFNEKLHKSVSHVEPSCLKALQGYYWPGNIRQLENVLEHAVLMSEGDVVGFSDLPKELRLVIDAGESGDTDHSSLSTAVAAYESGESFKDIVKKQTQVVEKELITRALEEWEGNITRTAEKLGLSRKGLQLKLKELGLRGKDFDENG